MRLLDKFGFDTAAILRRKCPWPSAVLLDDFVDLLHQPDGFGEGDDDLVVVREDVWNFHIGGYQVCEKWLKDRKGRILTKDDLSHYHKIVISLAETIRLMKEIDVVIDQHGGWPIC